MISAHTIDFCATLLKVTKKTKLFYLAQDGLNYEAWSIQLGQFNFWKSKGKWPDITEIFDAFQSLYC